MRTLWGRWFNLCFIAMLGLAFQSSATAQSLVCAMDSAAGIAFDRATKEWKSTTFAPKGKFLVSRSTNPNAKWEVKSLGNSNETAFCKEDFSSNGELICKGFYQDFYINRKALRFIHTYYAGYWNEESSSKLFPNRVEGSDTPLVAAGTCAPV